MTTTPWGNANELRARRLPPGPANSPDVVARNQRERLFAAMIAVVAEQSYEATRVEDAVALSGVSRSGFYQHFANKRECFLATFDALVELALDRVGQAIADRVETKGGGADDWSAPLTAGLEALVELIDEQPAAARLVLVDAYAAGPEAVERLDELSGRVERFLKRTLGSSPERAGMPADMVRGLVGGVRRVLETRLRRNQQGDLAGLVPQLVEWVTGYHAPPERLRRSRVSAPADAVPAVNPDDPAERLTAAIGEVAAAHGYANVTIAEVADVARASLTTFYANFDTKEDAFGAAIDRAADLCLGATRTACEAADDWREGVRDGVDAAFAVLGAEPALAAVATSEAAGAGPWALAHRDRAFGDVEWLLAERTDGRALAAPELSDEATTGALLTLVGGQVHRGRAARMRELTPVAAYIALARTVDPAETCAVVNAPPQRRAD